MVLWWPVFDAAKSLIYAQAITGYILFVPSWVWMKFVDSMNLRHCIALHFACWPQVSGLTSAYFLLHVSLGCM